MAFPAQAGNAGGLPPLKRPADTPEIGAALKLPNLGLGAPGAGSLDLANISSLGALGGAVGLNNLLATNGLAGTPPATLGAGLQALGPTGVAPAPGAGPGGNATNALLALLTAPGAGAAAPPIGPAPPPLPAALALPPGAPPAPSIGPASPPTIGPAPPPPPSPPSLTTTVLATGPTSVDANGNFSVTLEVPQAKIALVANQSTLAAIKAMSGATCIINQVTSQPGSVTLTISGSQAEVEKCRALVGASLEGPPAGGGDLAAAATGLAPALGAGTSAGALAGLLGVAAKAPGPLPTALGAALPAATGPGALQAGGGLSTATLTALVSALSGANVPPPPPGSPAPAGLNLVGLATAGAAGGGVGGAGSLDLTKLGSLITGLAAGNSALAGTSNLTAALAALLPGSTAPPAGSAALSTALAALTGGGVAGGAGYNYSQLMAAVQVAGAGGKDSSSGNLLEGVAAVGDTRQPQAFDKDALARLAREAKEKQVAEDAAASERAVLEKADVAVAATATAAAVSNATAAIMPASEAAPHTASATSPPPAGQGEVATAAAAVTSAIAQAAAAVGLPPEMLQQLKPPKDDPLQVATSTEAASLAEVEGATMKAAPPVAPATLAAPVVPQAPALAAPVPFAGFTIMASSSTNKASQKDASSVLGILQQAQANIASQRAGGARGVPPGAVPTQLDGHISGKVENSATALEVLHRRLEAAPALAPDGRKALEREVLAMLPKLDPGRAADLVVRAQASEAMRTQELLDHVCQVLVAGIPRFGSAHLTKVTGALSAWTLTLATSVDTDGRPNHSQDVKLFFNGMSTEVSLRLMDVAPGDLSRVAISLSNIGLATIKLFSSLARAAVARSDRFSTSELVSLVGAFDKASFFHTGLFEALVKSLKINIREVNPRDVLKGMTSLATCGVRDDALGQAVCETVLPKLNDRSLTAEELCTLAWAFCTLDLHHADLFRFVFRALEATETLSGETLCQLFEIHLTLKAFHSATYSPFELEEEVVQSLRDHYKKHRGENGQKFKMERSSERLHDNVADMLKEVIEGSVAMQHPTALGFSVDVAATKKRSSTAFMYLDIDGPHTLVRSLDPGDVSSTAPTAWRVRGSVLLKRRVLQKHGYRIAAITEDSWNALDSSRDKRDHLRSILRNAGVEKDRIS